MIEKCLSRGATAAPAAQRELRRWLLGGCVSAKEGRGIRRRAWTRV